MPPPNNRKWWRASFLDHPGYKDKQPESFTTSKGDKVKCICSLCFNYMVENLAAQDAELVSNLQLSVARTTKEIHQFCRSPIYDQIQSHNLLIQYIYL